MQPNIVSKAEFSRLAGVTAGRVSQWISSGELSGDALVREGRAERVNVVVARRKLGRRLAADQRLPADRGGSSSGKGETIEAIQRERLAALRLANERARAAALVDAGRFLEAGAVRVELGRVAGRMVSAFEGIIPALASAVAAGSTLSERDALHLLRVAWLTSRARLAGIEAEAAVREPEVVEASP